MLSVGTYRILQEYMYMDSLLSLPTPNPLSHYYYFKLNWMLRGTHIYIYIYIYIAVCSLSVSLSLCFSLSCKEHFIVDTCIGINSLCVCVCVYIYIYHHHHHSGCFSLPKKEPLSTCFPQLPVSRNVTPGSLSLIYPSLSLSPTLW